ncbi:MAG TPA: PLP-dependent aminotransferase family protein [Xanthobacteraceae bacterium]|nr:PLP-dependent aminotransferase family protein [Xanthobacteraceae bacterium]
MPAQAHFRYEEVANLIAGLVDSGTLRPGSRAPSLRAISKQQRVSLATALEAYRLLEDRGVLEARPQSGHYVTVRAASRLATPATSNPPSKATSVAVSAILARLSHHAADPRLLPLGLAIPSPDLLAAGRLDRFLARAARTKGAQYNTYGVPKGDLRLRQEIARRALRFGAALSPEDIVITCGCMEAVTLALSIVTRPGDTVAIESPTYFGLLRALEALGLKALELPTEATNGVDLAALKRALERRSAKACLFSSSFNNPLGCTVPDEKKLKVLALLAKYRVPLIEDDISGDIYFGSRRPTPFMALDRFANTIIYCSSFSKTIAPGYRIGWLATKSASQMQYALDRKLAFTLSGPPLLQVAFAEFLSSGGYDNHLRRIRRVFQDTIGQMSRAVEQSFPQGTKVSRPAGNFVLWLELPKSVRTAVLLEQALESGICFAPGEAFSISGRYGHCLRLSCGHGWNDRIAKGVLKLGKLACAAAAQ